MNKNIEGIKITPLKIIKDHRGSVMHMIRNDNEVFEEFGEIYFSTIFENKVKAWHLHKEATLNYACVFGKVKLVLFDERKTSKTYGEYQELFLSLDNYSLITIPPNIWNGFKGMNKESSIIANCLNLPHNEKEMVRLEIDDMRFNYKW
jgi:dTDP-4-dehydrorhamnose 3,5-epimerase|tara:strand:- start:1019 stop:1462 length:444 start_codon:yes stop_codon:yes gene_type:complete